jgi:hypothetical protein
VQHLVRIHGRLDGTPEVRVRQRPELVVLRHVIAVQVGPHASRVGDDAVGRVAREDDAAVGLERNEAPEVCFDRRAAGTRANRRGSWSNVAQLPGCKCAVAGRRSDDAVPATCERVQQMLEVAALQHADGIGDVDSSTWSFCQNPARARTGNA